MPVMHRATREGRPGRSLRELPLSERPRERILRTGPASLTSAELIAILWGSGIPGATVVVHDVKSFRWPSIST